MNLAEQQVEVYRTPVGDAYQTMQVHTGESTLAPLFAPDWVFVARELLQVV